VERSRAVHAAGGADGRRKPVAPQHRPTSARAGGAEPNTAPALGGDASSAAGLLFVVPLLLQLGLPEVLEQHPELIELDLPARLARALADRTGITPDDPSLSAFPLAEPASFNPTLPAGWAFVAPGQWERLTCERVALRRLAAEPGRRVLLERRGRLALALWSGRAPLAVRDAARRGRARRGTPVEEATSADLLIASWLVALRRWCLLASGIPLDELVLRPGHVSTTRTHVDILFDSQQVDVRIRRAGLDIDPGWVPWLGRVVLFHYVDRGARFDV
jgi:hypothetical protein